MSHHLCGQQVILYSEVALIFIQLKLFVVTNSHEKLRIILRWFQDQQPQDRCYCISILDKRKTLPRTIFHTLPSNHQTTI